MPRPLKSGIHMFTVSSLPATHVAGEYDKRAASLCRDFNFGLLVMPIDQVILQPK